jgi:signal peptidase II
MRRHWLGLALTAGVVALDRLTKIWVESSIDLYDVRVVVPGLFNIVHSQNRGIAFGILNEGASDFSRVLLIAVSLAVLAYLAASIWRGAHGQALSQWSVYLIAGGALGNLYDRIARGSVTDFLDVYAGGYHWPTFNVADSAITLGALWLLVELWREDRKRKLAEA